MAQINLTKRSALSSAMSFTEVDANWTAIENAVNDGAGLYYFDTFYLIDETTAITTGTKITTYLPVSLTDITVAACITTAPTGAALVVDIHKAGVTMMATNKISIDIGDFSTNTASTPPAVTVSDYTAFDKLEIIIDQIGSTIAGAGVKVFLIGNIV